MSEIAMSLQSEVERLESLFIAKLMKMGQPELVAEFRDIATLREAASVVNRRAVRTRGKSNNDTCDANDSVRVPAPDGFVMTDEVRKAIGKIKSHRFRASQVFELMAGEWPEYITRDKRPSIGATLSNLVTNGELSSEKDGQRKVWYSVSNLRYSEGDIEAILDAAIKFTPVDRAIDTVTLTEEFEPPKEPAIEDDDIDW